MLFLPELHTKKANLLSGLFGDTPARFVGEGVERRPQAEPEQGCYYQSQ